MTNSVDGIIMDMNLTAMNDFIDKRGEDCFQEAVFYHAFSESAMDYIHPSDELRKTKRFDIIQKAFINAYV
jgi:hypothetical protein